MSENLPSAKRKKYDFRLFTKVMFAFMWPLAGLTICSILLATIFDVTGVSSDANVTMFQQAPWLRVPVDLIVSTALFLFVVTPFYRVFFTPDIPLKYVFGLQRRPTWKDLGLTFIAYGAYFACLIVTIMVIDALVPSFNLDEAQELGITQPDTLLEYMGIFLVLVVIPPVTEELIFRGFMFSSLRNTLPFWPTAVLVSIAFAVVHGQWNVGIDVFILSIFLCGLREYTGSIWPAIFLHALKNFVAFASLYIFKVTT